MAPKSRAAFERWVPLARQVVRRSLALGWRDVLHIYSYAHTIPLAEALALEARGAGSDTVITLMTDDLWVTSMQELPLRWLRTPSAAEQALARVTTAYVYLGGPADGRRFRDISPERFIANTAGGSPTDALRHRRDTRTLELAVGRLTPERAQAYGLDYGRWRRSYEAALGVDLAVIERRGRASARRLAGLRAVRVTSAGGAVLTCELAAKAPLVDDGVIDRADVRRGLLESSLPAGKVMAAVRPRTASGEVRFDLPVHVAGRAVRGLVLRFEKGLLVGWSARANAELLRNLLPRARARRTLGWLTVGFNPRAEPSMLDNGIVDGAVGIGIGKHPAFDGSEGVELTAGRFPITRAG